MLHKQLKAKLEAYSAAIPSRAQSPDWSARLGRWSLYAAATGAALASATSAEAGIITGNLNITLNGVRTPNINRAANTAVDAFLSTHPVTASTKIWGSFGVKQQYIHFPTELRGTLGVTGQPEFNSFFFFLTNKSGDTGLLNRFRPGSAIVEHFSSTTGLPIGIGNDANIAYVNQLLPGRTTTAKQGAFVSGQEGTLGFVNDSGNAGWIQIEWTSSQSDGIPDTVTLGNWALNTTPGDGILAGEDIGSSAAPEPGSAPLALLAMGAAGILAWRRRRAAAKQS